MKYETKMKAYYPKRLYFLDIYHQNQKSQILNKEEFEMMNKPMEEIQFEKYLRSMIEK